MVDECSDFYTWGSVGGVFGSLPTVLAMGSVYALTALPALGVATSGAMRAGADAMNRAAPGSVVRSGTWWASLGRNADPAASAATAGAVPFQVGSLACSANP